MMKILSQFITLVFLMLTATNIVLADGSLPKETQDKIAALMQQAEKRQGIVGQSLAILHKGKLVYTGARGLASIELGVSASPETVYPLFSVTKLFTSTTMLQLVEEGKAQLDDPVGDYLSDIPASWKPITLRQLLSHISGLPEYFLSVDVLATMTEEEILQSVWDTPFQFKTSSASRYNSTNYLLLRQVIQTITSDDITSVVQRRMIERFGMQNTRYGAEHTIVPKRASLYEGAKTGLKGRGNLDFPSYAFGGVGLNSSVVELATWFEALLAGEVISADRLKEIWQPMHHTNGTVVRRPYGWEYRQTDGTTSVGHWGGGIVNVRHFFRESEPEETVTVIHLTNGGNSEYLNLEEYSSNIARLLMQEKETPIQRLKREMIDHMEADRWPEAVALHQSFKKDPATDEISTEGTINALGYAAMLGQAGTEKAIIIFTFNVSHYPNSANAHDSLGEAYLRLGKVDLAIKSYTKALSLDPENTRIKQLLIDLNNKST